MGVNAEGIALFGGREVNEISMGYFTFLVLTQSLSVSFKLV